MARQFVIVTNEFTGLGWADQLDRTGETVTVAVKYAEEKDPETRDRMKQIGDGWLDVVELSKAIDTLQTDETYWIFSRNDWVEEAEALREAGQKVFGTSYLSEKMEHDRNYACEIADQCGLKSTPTEEFSDRESGVKFLDEHPDKAYVLKVNDNKFNFQTFVPIRKRDKDANRETYNYLKNGDGECGSYILQERIPIEEGTEVNVEAWMYEGKPFLATMGLEVKRKNTYDLGEMTSCAGDFMQFIPLESKIVEATIGKFFPFYKDQHYTGFADVNVIFTPDGTPHFLEVCNRLGYNSHPNMFYALGKDTFGNIMADYMDGKIDTIRDRFRDDIGCSLSLYLDHPRPGLPVHIAKGHEHQFYMYDGYKKDNQLLLTGYSDEVGVVFGHGPTISDAWDLVSESVALDEIVSFPDMYYRWDLADDNYYNAPVLRLKALKKMGLI